MSLHYLDVLDQGVPQTQSSRIAHLPPLPNTEPTSELLGNGGQPAARVGCGGLPQSVSYVKGFTQGARIPTGTTVDEVAQPFALLPRFSFIHVALNLPPQSRQHQCPTQRAKLSRRLRSPIRERRLGEIQKSRATGRFWPVSALTSLSESVLAAARLFGLRAIAIPWVWRKRCARGYVRTDSYLSVGGACCAAPVTTRCTVAPS
jgi:hypothetical protein